VAGADGGPQFIQEASDNPKVARREAADTASLKAWEQEGSAIRRDGASSDAKAKLPGCYNLYM